MAEEYMLDDNGMPIQYMYIPDVVIVCKKCGSGGNLQMHYSQLHTPISTLDGWMCLDCGVYTTAKKVSDDA